MTASPVKGMVPPRRTRVPGVAMAAGGQEGDYGDGGEDFFDSQNDISGSERAGGGGGNNVKGFANMMARTHPAHVNMDERVYAVHDLPEPTHDSARPAPRNVWDGLFKVRDTVYKDLQKDDPRYLWSYLSSSAKEEIDARTEVRENNDLKGYIRMTNKWKILLSIPAAPQITHPDTSWAVRYSRNDIIYDIVKKLDPIALEQWSDARDADRRIRARYSSSTVPTIDALHDSLDYERGIWRFWRHAGILSAFGISCGKFGRPAPYATPTCTYKVPPVS